MELGSISRAWGGRVVVAAGLLLAAAGCAVEEPAQESAVPDGIIQEMQSDTSITTDVNARAPAFAREDLEGDVIRTQDFIGNRVILLDFWSIFCQSCLLEIPFLKELYQTYHDQGLEIISINTDFFPRARIEHFMKKTKLDLPFPVVMDRDQSLSKLFHVDALPVTVLIDSAGWIRMVHLGFRPQDRKTIEGRVKKACRKIKEQVVTLQPVDGRTAFAPPDRGSALLEAGASVPDFEALDGEGALSGFDARRDGSPAVVFFWSLFCQPCREEFPRLRDLSRKFSSRGLKTFAVNIDTARLHEAAARFSRKKGEGITALFDPSSADGSSAIAEAFGVHFTPSLFLVGADGSVVYSASGEVPASQLEAGVEGLLE